MSLWWLKTAFQDHELPLNIVDPQIPSSSSLASSIRGIAGRHDSELAPKVNEPLAFELNYKSTVSKYKEAVEEKKRAVAEAAHLRENDQEFIEENRKLNEQIVSLQSSPNTEEQYEILARYGAG
jgi:hypothetical protein